MERIVVKKEVWRIEALERLLVSHLGTIWFLQTEYVFIKIKNNQKPNTVLGLLVLSIPQVESTVQVRASPMWWWFWGPCLCDCLVGSETGLCHGTRLETWLRLSVSKEHWVENNLWCALWDSLEQETPATPSSQRSTGFRASHRIFGQCRPPKHSWQRFGYKHDTQILKSPVLL
jgi:hypothetical protein